MVVYLMDYLARIGMHPGLGLESRVKNTFIEVCVKRVEKRSRSAPPSSLRISTGTQAARLGGIDQRKQSHSALTSPSVEGKACELDMTHTAECAAVYRTYIATAPSKPSGRTLKLDGLSRDWVDAQFMAMVMDCFPLDEVDFVYLPLHFWAVDFWIRDDVGTNQKRNKRTIPSSWEGMP